MAFVVPKKCKYSQNKIGKYAPKSKPPHFKSNLPLSKDFPHYCKLPLSLCKGGIHTMYFNFQLCDFQQKK